MGCAALLTLATAPGRAAIAQAFDTVVSASGPQKAEGEDDTQRQVGLYSPSSVSAIFDVETGFVNLAFTSPNLAYWKDGSWPDFTDEDKINFPIEKIEIARCEGSYFYDSEAEVIAEITDVEWLTDYTYTDKTQLEHGKTYSYQIVGYCNGCKGSAATVKVDVGFKIDPAADFSVVAGENGAMQVTVSFTTPTTTNDGKHVIPEGETITKIEITRKEDSWYSDEEVIKTFEDVAPGTKLSYVDESEDLKPGTKYEYRVLFYFDGIQTKDYTNLESVFVGPDQPKAPSNVAAILQEDGSVKVTWEAPTEGVNGGWLDLSAVRFKIERGLGTSEYYAKWIELENGYEGTELVDSDLPEEGMYMYRISSQVGENTYRGAVTEGVIAGPPAAYPFTESWPDRVAEHTSWTKGAGDWTEGSSPSIYYYDEDNNYLSLDITPADNDGGLMYTYPSSWSDEAGDIFTLTSGRIAMADAINPVVKFSFFDFSKDVDDNEIKVYAAADGGEFKQLEDVDFSGFPHDNQWVSVMGSLAEYVEACEYIQIRFEVTLGEKKCKTCIDAVEVRDAKFADLTVESVSAPEKFYPGASMNVSVKLSNSGDFASEPFAAMLYIGGEELGYAECEGVASLGTTVMSIPVTIPETVNGGETEISVEIVGVWEPNMDDNSGSKAVEVVTLPAPSGLGFDADDKLLTWTAVDELPFYDGSNEVADDFSAYDDCATGEFGGWTVVDGDGYTTLCLPGYENYTNERGSTGGFVFQPSIHDVINGTKGIWDTPEQGGKCFVFPAATSYADDWLISPELTGAAQTVTFKLAAYSSFSSIVETYEFCVSYTDAQTESFEVLKKEEIRRENQLNEDGIYPIEWEERSFDLPEGVKYFAIHYTKYYGDMLAVTDFHFTTGSGMTSDPTEFVGYNVYLDGSKVNEEPLTDTKYEVPAETSGDYVVKAAYNNAESAPTEAVSVNTTGVEAAGALAGKLLNVEGTTLVISGTGAYTVADIAGRTVAAGNGAARVEVAAGTYVVAVDGEVFKVAVK